MKNLTELIRQYKSNKDSKIIGQIYFELFPLVEKKSKFIFEKKYYPLSLYNKCIHCKKCDNNDKFICENCEKCICIKGFFNLKREHLCDIDDVKNDLWLEIFRIIDNYDVEKDFNIYLFSCIFEWRPSFINKNYIKSLLNKPLTYTNHQGEEKEIEIPSEEKKSELTIDEIFKVAKTKIEKKVLSILLKNKEITQDKVAKEIGITQQSVAKIIRRFRKKIKKWLLK